MSPQKPKEKFLSYFDLCDAMEKPGCSICTLIGKYSDRYLDGLLWERVNDGGTRMELRESFGFCNWHAWKAVSIFDSALGMAIIYEDLLRGIEDRLARLQKVLPTQKSFLRQFFRSGKSVKPLLSLEPAQPCPACRAAQFFETIFLEIFLDFIGEPELENKFRLSSGICFFHLVEAVKEFPRHENLPALIRHQLNKLASLRKELAEFIRKNDYQYAAEPRGSEVDSWNRAVEMVVGKSGVFSNQMHRAMKDDAKAPGTLETGSQESKRTSREWAKYSAQLEEEISRLKELLKKQDQYDKLADKKVPRRSGSKD